METEVHKDKNDPFGGMAKKSLNQQRDRELEAKANIKAITDANNELNHMKDLRYAYILSIMFRFKMLNKSKPKKEKEIRNKTVMIDFDKMNQYQFWKYVERLKDFERKEVSMVQLY